MTVLRADARRNLDRILEAAAEAFAELGPDVTIDEIARRAGVGHGTVFRRFPTKDGLRAAVLRLRLEEILVRANELLDEPDAGAGARRVRLGRGRIVPPRPVPLRGCREVRLRGRLDGEGRAARRG